MVTQKNNATGFGKTYVVLYKFTNTSIIVEIALKLSTLEISILK